MGDRFGIANRPEISRCATICLSAVAELLPLRSAPALFWPFMWTGGRILGFSVQKRPVEGLIPGSVVMRNKFRKAFLDSRVAPAGP